ncbi:hypothetical protein PYW08_008157 [Mythimna loreyi]|uniref:Uncharacterized protein n=1 Tax=Mythimna loreyi TaxID=667449 RepID=A0ACC2QBL0_9NEOP|nr:hypothetical protein PYW08_008157 [Mythimna loreyi]
MVVVLYIFLAVSAVSTLGEGYENSELISPCPDVFTYESEPDSDRWYGVVNVTTDNLDQLQLDILLDDKADILGSWIGEVTTVDNKNYTIIVQNNSLSVEQVRFFVKYKPFKRVPRLETIRLNGKEICSSTRDSGTKDRWPDFTEEEDDFTRDSATKNRWPSFTEEEEDDFDSGHIDWNFEISRKKYPQDPLISPCPDVFTYEPLVPESDRWYGIINMTKQCNHSLQLNILLDDKADMLGNWIGEVSTLDNRNYTITADLQNSSITVAELRFFVKYNPMKRMPRIWAIRLDGKDICNRTRKPTNGSTQKGPDLDHRFVDVVLGILQEENWGLSSVDYDEQEEVAPKSTDPVTKLSETTTELSQSTTAPRRIPERKKMITEDEMGKPVIYVYPVTSSTEYASTEATLVSSKTKDVAPNPIDPVAKYAETTTESSMSTMTLKRESERKRENLEEMNKPLKGIASSNACIHL